MGEFGDVSNSEPPKKINGHKPFMPQEVASLRSKELIGGRKGNRYTTDVGSVSTIFISPDLDKLAEENLAEITSFLEAKENGEGYRYEPLIVNALFKQFEIAKKFGLTEDSIFKDFKLVVADKGTMLVNDTSELYLRVLDEHVRQLKQQGATYEQLVIELAGHIFHESVHEGRGNMRAVLFNGGTPFGEIATVTAQMAYYLDEGYNGPTSYNINRYNAGFKKIQNGENNSRDYDVATYVGVNLLLQSLEGAYPAHLSDTGDLDPVAKCRAIVEKLSSEERQELIPSLKKAITNSTQEKVFEDILDQSRQQKPDSP